MPSNQHFVRRRYRSVVIKADSSFIKGLDTARNAIFTFLLAIAPPQTFLGNQPDAACKSDALSFQCKPNGDRNEFQLANL